MKYRSGIMGDGSETDATANVEKCNMQQESQNLSPEDFLERVRNVEKILENCRKSLRGS